LYCIAAVYVISIRWNEVSMHSLFYLLCSCDSTFKYNIMLISTAAKIKD